MFVRMHARPAVWPSGAAGRRGVITTFVREEIMAAIKQRLDGVACWRPSSTAFVES